MFGDGSVAVLLEYAFAKSNQEPVLPPLVHLLSHHLDCIMHSAIVAGAVTLLWWSVRRSLWIPLLSWWSHIVIAVFRHSARYYPAPVLYPITERGFDGFAWEHVMVPAGQLRRAWHGLRVATTHANERGWTVIATSFISAARSTPPPARGDYEALQPVDQTA